MAGVDPYSPCPCGSGQKFKWCCQKVEAIADKTHRLYEGGQTEAAIKTLDEGLRKEPNNPWLLTRKGIMQIQLNQPEPAKATFRQLLRSRPRHFSALILLTRCVLETEGPVNGAGVFQQALALIPDEQRPFVGKMARLIANLMVQANLIPAAIKHLELVSILGDPDPATSDLWSLDTSPNFSPWLKDRLELVPAPADLDNSSRDRFSEALAMASRGLWAPAAALFDALSIQAQGGAADYNLGLCRLWLGDEAGAVAPIRRRSRQLGTSTEAVDLEVLCQLIEPIHPDDRVEKVQLSWPLRNRDALLTLLRSKNDVFEDEPTPLDPDDPESIEYDLFFFLNKPAIDKHSGHGLTPDDLPRILGRVFVGTESVLLETIDDGRVDLLGDRLTAMAGTSIAPAHPRTKVLNEESRSGLALHWNWLFPEMIDPVEALRIDREMRVQIFRDIWPVTPMPYLGFRTPDQAARDGDASVLLRAALLQYEVDSTLKRWELDVDSARARFGLDPEPAIDPETVDLTRLRLGRLASLPADRLDDLRLLTLYRQARKTMLMVPVEAACRELIARNQSIEYQSIDFMSVYTDLASIVLNRGNPEEALSWIARGRQADLPSRRAPNAPIWDMVEIRVKMRFQAPETWVPELAIILERYLQDRAASSTLITNLTEMGLIRMIPNPDHPDDFLIDSRPLQALMAEYGPRVTTSTGRLGVSAARPELWTPGGPASGSGGAIWTPGADPGPSTGVDKPKLILPGR